MMRGDDEQDLDDIAFMVRHDNVTPEQLEGAFRDAVIPAVPELQSVFAKSQPLVREIVRQGGAKA